MGTRIIAEAGSTHMGKWEYCKEILDRCADLRIDAVKFQLFPNEEQFTKSGNVWMPPDLYLECVDYGQDQGVGVAASVFGENEFEFLIKTNPPFVKIAYSQKHRADWTTESLSHGIETIVSCDVMTDKQLPRGVTKLFCIPQYPVYFNICFDTLFPRFDGFSDHTLGFDQTLEAIHAGAQIIEKHIKLNHADVVCPDSYFALGMGDFAAFVACVRQIEKGGSL